MDIKAQNFLYQDKKIFICDFGISSLENQDTLNVELCSIHCRPPELLSKTINDVSKSDLKTICNKIDMWSLGRRIFLFQKN